MKSPSLISSGTLCLALAMMSCSTAAMAPSDNGGAGSIGVSGTAGVSTSGGASGTVGVAGAATGGSDPGTAGSGGTAQAGTASGGSAGSSAGGTGGAAAVAGGGSGGTSGAAPVVDTTLTGSWDGALIQYGCGNSGSGYDCAQPSAVNCKSYDANNNPVVATIPPSNGVPTEWTMGGTTGVIYNVTFRLRGVVEVTSYIGGTRAAGTESVLTTPRNLFQSGGTDQGSGGPSFDYNTYELHVTPAVTGAANVYYLNSVTDGQNPHANNSPTTHLTFDVDYTATIKVPGGGKISLKVTDSNCRQVQNCGASSGNTCASPRSVSLAGAMPAAPTFAQPLSNGQYYGQWVFFDITNVTAAQ